MDSKRKVVTMDEVEKHRDRNDIWLLISGKVYDITRYIGEHPGGEEVLLAVTGTDATDDFEDTGHSDEAIELMKKYYIADIDTSSIPVPGHSLPTTVSHKRGESGFVVKILQLVVALLILGLAYGFHFYGKTENKGSYWAFMRSFIDNIV